MIKYYDTPALKEERYERLLSEQICWRKKAEEDIKKYYSLVNKRNRRLPNSVYFNFYEQGKNLSRDIGKDIERKVELMYKFLPGRFGRLGVQPIYELDDLKKGSLFNHLIDYSRKRIEE